MERDNRYYRNEGYRTDRDNDWRNSGRNAGDKLSNYSSRYQNRGNYYGMPDTDHEYEDVKAWRGETFGNNSSGPMQRTSRNNADMYGGSGNQSSYGSQRDRDRGSYRSRNERDNDYRSPESDRHHDHQNRDNHYRYGDPNPYMGGYEQSRGTGWQRESSGAYRGSYSTGDNSRYGRQDNSYQSHGRGRRYSDFGRDEQRSYNPGDEDSYNDRSSYGYSSADNNYGRNQSRSNRFYNSDSNHDDYQQGEIRDISRGNEENYANGLYASNRSYVSEQDDRDFSNRSSKIGRRHASGPNYDYESPISSQTRSGSLR